MNSWVNVDALWKIVVVGILAGAGLPALFAVGVRALYPSVGGAQEAGGGRAAGSRPTGGALGYAVAAVCFAVVLAAIGLGIFVIVNHR
ncbi:hypothetical protein AB0E96_02635 [Kitasatospora sp. NPDC036755]|uniref:hypothetical protein n=1 Tax=Kitasatospora sp. NPDC036755 TaxID=3154600 RepID=UPI0033D83DF9